jgi:hypothetical protein
MSGSAADQPRRRESVQAAFARDRHRRFTPLPLVAARSGLPGTRRPGYAGGLGRELGWDLAASRRSERVQTP